jgi:hypothetical protein
VHIHRSTNRGEEGGEKKKKMRSIIDYHKNSKIFEEKERGSNPILFARCRVNALLCW